MIKIIKIKLDLNNEKDKQVYCSIKESLHLVTNGLKQKKKHENNLLRDMIKVPERKDALDIRLKSMSARERLCIWHNSFKKKESSSISRDEFSVNIIPNLNKKDFEVLEKIYLEEQCNIIN